MTNMTIMPLGHFSNMVLLFHKRALKLHSCQAGMVMSQELYPSCSSGCEECLNEIFRYMCL